MNLDKLISVLLSITSTFEVSNCTKSHHPPQARKNFISPSKQLKHDVMRSECSRQRWSRDKGVDLPSSESFFPFVWRRSCLQRNVFKEATTKLAECLSVWYLQGSELQKLRSTYMAPRTTNEGGVAVRYLISAQPSECSNQSS